MKNKFTMLDMRKGNSGRKVSVRSPGLIAAVKRSLNRAATRAPGQQGPSARRNGLGIKKSTYNYITKHDLKLKPYKILRLHKVTDKRYQLFRRHCTLRIFNHFRTNSFLVCCFFTNKFFQNAKFVQFLIDDA